MDRLALCEIWQQTQNITKKRFDAILHTLPSTKYSKLRNVHNLSEWRIRELEIPTTIETSKEDSLGMALRLKQTQGLNPVVLNFADAKVPGGCVEEGVVTQEEDLFRRTTYFQTLTKKFYPLSGHDLVYSPTVLVFRKSQKEQFALMEHPVSLAMIAIPALQGPEKEAGRMTNSYEIQMTKDKMEMMFQTAILHGHDALVLGAWGCGAFHNNPPEHIAELFCKVIKKYARYLLVVGFPIPSSEFQPNSNYDIFVKTLNKDYTAAMAAAAEKEEERDEVDVQSLLERAQNFEP